MDRHDLRCVLAMLWTSLGVGLNILFLQTTPGTGLSAFVLVPIFAGLAIGLSGLTRHIREHGRTMVFIDRVWIGSMVYLGLSTLCAYLFQPRLD